MSAWRSSSQSASGASPSTRRPAATPSRSRWCAWPATSRRIRRCRRCARRSTGIWARSTATPTRPTRCCARGSATATACPPRASRSATARATSCSPPARRCWSRARSSCTRGRRSRSTHTSPPPPARARSRSRSTASSATICRRCCARSPSRRGWCSCATPTTPPARPSALADIADFLAEVPPQVCVILDEAYCEFNTLDDADASLELLDAHPNLALLRTFSKVHGLCGLRVGFALCGSEQLPRALDQVRQPFFCNALAQAAAVEALAHQDEVEERVIKHGRRAHLRRRAPARARPRARRLGGELLLVRARRGPRRAGGHARPAGARRARARRQRARQRGAGAARHLRPAGGEHDVSSTRSQRC